MKTHEYGPYVDDLIEAKYDLHSIAMSLSRIGMDRLAEEIYDLADRVYRNAKSLQDAITGDTHRQCMDSGKMLKSITELAVTNWIKGNENE